MDFYGLIEKEMSIIYKTITKVPNIRKSLIPLSSLSSIRRQKSYENIIKSKVPDIIIPKKLITEYVWENLHKWQDKVAVVNLKIII